MSATQGSRAAAAISRLRAPPRVHDISPLTHPPLLPNLSASSTCFPENSLTRSTASQAPEPSEEDDHDHTPAFSREHLSLSSPKNASYGWAVMFTLSFTGSAYQTHNPQLPVSPPPAAQRILPRPKSQRARRRRAQHVSQACHRQPLQVHLLALTRRIVVWPSFGDENHIPPLPPFKIPPRSRERRRRDCIWNVTTGQKHRPVQSGHRYRHPKGRHCRC